MSEACVQYVTCSQCHAFCEFCGAIKYSYIVDAGCAWSVSTIGSDRIGSCGYRCLSVSNECRDRRRCILCHHAVQCLRCIGHAVLESIVGHQFKHLHALLRCNVQALATNNHHRLAIANGTCFDLRQTIRCCALYQHQSMRISHTTSPLAVPAAPPCHRRSESHSTLHR
jgi:hypothetical protein